MSFNPFKKNKINFLIEDHAVRYLELHQVDPLIVKNSGEKLIPPDTVREGRIVDHDAFLQQIRSIVEKCGLRKREVQFIVPDSLVVIRKVEIPKAVQMKEIPNYLSLEIGTSIHLPFDDPVFDIHLIQETDQFKEILLFAAPKQAISDFMAIFKEASLKPVVADVSSLALYRLYFKLKEINPQEHILFVHMGKAAVNATIFYNHQPMFMRHITTNLSNNEATVYEMDTEIDRDFVREISSEIERIINFYRFTIYQGSEQISKIIITGDFDELHEVQDMMQEVLGIPIELFAKEAIQVINEEQVLSPNQYITLGLALKEV